MKKFTIPRFYFSLLLISPLLIAGQLQQVENIVLDIPVLVPRGDTSSEKCVRKAIEMGFEDIRSEKVQYTDTNTNITRFFTMNALYEMTGNQTIDAVEAMNRLHPFDDQTFRDFTLMKRATIGPPTNEQTNIFSDFAQVLPNIQYSYTEINEPYDVSSALHLQTPPSIMGQFHAVRSFMEVYNWTHAVIVYDFSDSRYRLSSNLLLDILQKEDQNNSSITVKATLRIRSSNEENELADFNELPNLPHTDARIVLLLASVSGIRQTFCQAYHLQLQKSQFVWILFEKLPADWASTRYDQSEIDCTEEQLLSVSKSYIYFTKGGFREDNKTTVSNMTVDAFKRRIQTATGLQEDCDVKAAYAYDAVWTMVKSHQEIMNNNYGDLFYTKFVYLVGIASSREITSSIVKTNFEGITGHVSFKKNEYQNNMRIGFTSIHVQHGQSASITVGSHNTAKEVLTLIPDATEIIFKGNVPSDTATYVQTDYMYPKEFIIVIWLFAVAGIITALLLTLIAITCDRSSLSLSGRMATITIDSIISFGCILCYSSLVVYGVDTRFVERHQIVNVCYAFLCTLSIGFTLTFGSLFAKTWWKYKSFSAPSAIRSQTGSEISEWSLFVLIAIFLLVDVIIIITWTKISPFDIKIHELDRTPLSFAIKIQEIIRCKGKYINEFTIGMFCYKGVLLIFGVFLAWQTNSKLRGSASNSKAVLLAIYNTALVSVVGVICVLLLRDTDHRHALYAIIAVCVVLCTSTTLAMIYVPKLSKIFNLSSEENSTSESESESNNKTKFNKFTLEKLRRRVTNRNGKCPSVSSIQTNVSNLSISTLDSRRAVGTITSQTELTGRNGSFGSEQQQPRASSFTTDSSSNVGSFVSYNPSLLQASTVMEVPSEEEQEENPMRDTIIENRQSIDKNAADDNTGQIGIAAESA